MQTIASKFFVYGSLSVLLTMVGGMIPLVRKWKEDHLHSFVSFSAGVLIATAFVYLLPDAMNRGNPRTIGFTVLASFLALFILEKFVMIHPCEESHCDYHTMGTAAFVGMLTHTFFDGFALGASLLVEGLGFVVFFAIMAHKIPSSFALASVLKKGKWSNKKIIFSILLFGLTIPLGALASLTILQSIGSEAIGIALALSLGTFVYISTSDFLPEVHRSLDRRFNNLASFLLGIGILTFLALISPFHH